MKIFITGITGFAGGSIANFFSNKGYQVSGIGRKAALPPHVSGKCTYQQQDICKHVDAIEADIIIHAAALTSDTASFNNAYKVNVEGTQNVLNAIIKTSHFFYISSSSVYNFLNNSIKEKEACLNYEKLSVYGKSKFLAEQLIKKDKASYKKTILRPRAIYGKYDQVLLPRLLKLVSGNKLIIPAHLSKKISLTHIDNLLQAIELCINNQSTALEIFNVADNEVYDLYHVLTTLLPLVTGRQLKPVKIPAPIFNLLISINNKLNLNKSFNRFAALSLINTAVLNIEEIKQKLKYEPIKNFNNSYIEIGDWVHQENPWKFF